MDDTTPLIGTAARLGKGSVEGARRCAAFALQTARLALRRPGALRVGELVRYFPAWWSSLDRGAVPEDLPWLCFAAVAVLERHLTREMRVFEYGSGGSTVYLARRVARVWSVEHDPAWHEVVRGRLARAGLANCDLRLVEPTAADVPGDPSDPLSCASGDARFGHASFARYVQAIAQHPDRSLDLVLVDGRARPSCCRAAMPKVRVGGWLVLDNAEVPYYRRAREAFTPDAWELTDVYGPLPAVRHFSETCVWRRRR